ncbi:MAG: mechanosensitive ion channel [Thermoplasmata archaeon]|nr:mechanosensitive ion channel [Thermoplasmata archaeon]
MRSSAKRVVAAPVTILATCLMFAILLTASSGSALQTEFVQILSVDDYSKEVKAGGTATYNWTIMNVDSGADLRITVEASISGRGWTCSVNDPEIILLSNELGTITVTVTAPLEAGAVESNLSVGLRVYQDVYLVQVSSVGAETAIVGAFASANKVLGEFENPLPSPLDNEWGVFLLDVLIWLAVAYAFAYTLDGIGWALTRKTTSMLDDIILGIIRTPILILVFAYGVVQSLDALHMHIPTDVRASIMSVYGVLVVLIIFYLAYKLFKKILVYYGKIVAKKTASKIDDVLIPVVEKLGVVVIGFAALGYALGALNVDLTMFVAGGVVISMVLAFAAQETISNFFSGIFLLLDRPFAEGDTIILSDGDWCEVRRIGMRTTRLYRFTDASIVSLPNNRLVNDKIIRMSNVSDPGRVNVNVGVAYGSDPAKVRETITTAIKDNPYSLLDDENKQPIIIFDEMADSALVFKVILWINDRDKRIAARDKLVEDIYRRLNEAGIEIPFPQRVVYLKREA